MSNLTAVPVDEDSDSVYLGTLEKPQGDFGAVTIDASIFSSAKGTIETLVASVLQTTSADFVNKKLATVVFSVVIPLEVATALEGGEQIRFLITDDGIRTTIKGGLDIEQ